VALAALHNNIEKCILISTDKAVSAANVYGATKFIAERLFVDFNTQNSTKFAAVRYGNVIASRGSFIPLWLAKAELNEPIAITDFGCSRFLFTLYDAANTVLKSLEVMQGGEVFVPLLSSFTLETVKLALEKIIGKSITTKIIGLRPGEKLTEDMLSELEVLNTYQVTHTLVAISKTVVHSKVKYKYNQGPIRTSCRLSHNIDYLAKMIQRGLQENGA